MFASEYGWTPDVVLDRLTGPQVRGMLVALEHRYARQAEAMEAGGSNNAGPMSGNDPNTLYFDEDLSDSVLARWGVQVVAPPS